jgi:hypothetical protein
MKKKLNFNKDDNFDLTKELEVFKNQQWTVKYKYKLLKAINTKYNLILAHDQNRTQERFKNGKISDISKENKNEFKQDRALNTDPEILEMLIQLKRYFHDKYFKVKAILIL